MGDVIDINSGREKKAPSSRDETPHKETAAALLSLPLLRHHERDAQGAVASQAWQIYVARLTDFQLKPNQTTFALTLCAGVDFYSLTIDNPTGRATVVGDFVARLILNAHALGVSLAPLEGKT